MKLTNAMREMFVDNVLASIPVVHKFDIETAKLEIRNAMESYVNDQIKAFILVYPRLVSREKYVQLPALKYLNKNECKVTPNIHVIDHISVATDLDMSKWVEQKRLYDEESVKRNSLKTRLLDIAYSCSTLDKLKANLPELEQYMPKEKLPTKNLPISSGSIVTDLLDFGLKLTKSA